MNAVVNSLPNAVAKIPKIHSTIITKVLTEFKNDLNPLQPTAKQVAELKANEKTYTFLQSLTPYKWAQTLESFKNLLFCGKSKSKISDQEARAEQLAKRILANPKIKEVVLMDGHGRFMLSLLKKLGLRANRLTYTVVDINSNVVEWHKYFFPKNTESKLGDIYNYEPKEDRIVYMNFCGIGGLNGQKKLANYLANIVKPENKSPIEGVLRPLDERADEWLLLDKYPPNTWLSPMAKNYMAQKLFDGPQNNFPTFLLKFGSE